MGNIRLLDRTTIDKIAAGEVVERPLSIVKELLENSIDAGSTSIEIEIKNGGKSYIRVTDNGSGILEDDIELIFKRHATSKIRNIDDLYSSHTLGFRGEALSSIAAVSRVRLLSRHSLSDVGFNIAVDGGEVKKKESKGAMVGTTIEVSDLFFNTPVRLKFLKSDTTEGNSIVDIVERLALMCPYIDFKLINNGKEQLNTVGSNSLKDVIFDIYKREVYDNLLEINADIGVGKITGYIGKPVIARGNRNRQSFFINNRYVKSYLLMKAVAEGYTSFLMQHQYPFFVLNLELNPMTVDVNIHPSKMEVSFENAQEVYRQLYHTVRNRLNALTVNNVTEIRLDVGTDEHEAKFDENTKSQFNTFDDFKNCLKNENISNVNDIGEAKKISSCSINGPVGKQGLRELEIINSTYNQNFTNTANDMRLYDISPIVSEAFNSYGNHINIIGQLFNTYILAEIDDKLYIVDQHAAHEKINFERLIRELSNDEIISQQLLMPTILELNSMELSIIKKHLDVFINLGFDIEAFGDDAYIVRAVPTSFYRMDIKELFKELLDHLDDTLHVKNIEVIKDKIADVACKASIKGGWSINNYEAKKLIEELLSSDAPFNCPHGRPTMITMSRYELEKKFKRIV